MQRDQVLVLVHSTRSHSSQLLHVRTDTEQQTQVHTERTNVSASLAADPEDTEVAVVVELDELGLVDGSDTQLALDGGDQGRALEERAGEQLKGAGELGLAARDLVVESYDSNVLLSGSLLGLDQARGAVDADDQTSCDFGIESTAVASLLDAEHALHPGDDFVGRGVRGLVELDGQIMLVRRIELAGVRFLTLMTPEETAKS